MPKFLLWFLSLNMQCELKWDLKWIAMPDNLANNSANLQRVARLACLHDVYNYIYDCAVTVGVPLTVEWHWHSTRAVTQSHRQSVPTQVTSSDVCFHGKFAANSRAKFVHCHIHLWCLVYESVRSAYRTAVMMTGRECKIQGMYRYAIFDWTRR